MLSKLLLFSSLFLYQTQALPQPQEEDETGLDWEPAENTTAALRHCGTLKFWCNGAAGACNNACYYINCVKGGDKRFTMGPQTDIDNRVHSGCTTSASKGLCGLSPFSQRFLDRQPYDPKRTDLDCDEFPMAAMQQKPFAGPVRNSIRCIDKGENRSTSLGAFLSQVW
jgi:hypothetical protein